MGKFLYLHELHRKIANVQVCLPNEPRHAAILRTLRTRDGGGVKSQTVVIGHRPPTSSLLNRDNF